MHTRHTIVLPGRPPLALGERPILLATLEQPDLIQVLSLLAQDIDIFQLSASAATASVQQELDTIMPAIDAIIAAGITAPIVIATANPLIADQAIQAGATLVYDLEGLAGAPEMVEIAALHAVPIIARPSDLAIARASAAGIQLILDFGQTALKPSGHPILAGPMPPHAATAAYHAGAHILHIVEPA